MSGPFYADRYGITRLAPGTNTLDDGTKPGELNSNAEARGSGGLPGMQGGVGTASKGGPNSAPGNSGAPGPEAKYQIDPRLLDVLIGGGGAAGVLLASMLRNRGKPPVVAPDVVPEPGTAIVPSRPKVTQLNEEVIPRGGRQRYLPGQPGTQIEAGGQARIGTSVPPTAQVPANDVRYLPNQQGSYNPRQVPTTTQGAVDAAYSVKAAQDAKAAADLARANPGRDAARARIGAWAAAMRRVIK